MTLDPGQEQVRISEGLGINFPARSLTVDQAYAKAYSHLRQILYNEAAATDEPDTARALRWEAEHVASILQRELTELFYDGPLAAKLARPE